MTHVLGEFQFLRYWQVPCGGAALHSGSPVD